MADNIENTTTRKETAKEVMWLNIVWSMTILNKAPHKCWASVLTTEFYNRLLCKFNKSYPKLKNFNTYYSLVLHFPFIMISIYI